MRLDGNQAVLWVLLGASACWIGTAVANGDMEEEATIEYVLTGMQSNAEKINTGRGSLSWVQEGEHFAPRAEAPSTFNATFSFDGPKLRYDREFGDDRTPRKCAINGQFWYEYRVYGHDSYPHVRPDAYVRSASLLEGSEFYGNVIDLRRMTQPKIATGEEILDAIAAGDVTCSIADKGDDCYTLTLRPPGDSDKEWRLTLDGGQGYNVTREQKVYKGQLVDDVHREFQPVDGIWVLKSLDWVRYAEGSKADSVGQAPVDGRQRVTVNDVTLNTNVSDATFTLRGFGLPPRTRVWDEVSGIQYTLDPVAAVDEQIDRIMDALENRDVAPQVGGSTPASPMTGSRPNEVGEGAVNAGSAEEESPPTRTDQKPDVAVILWWLIPAFVCVASLLLWRRRRINRGPGKVEAE